MRRIIPLIRRKPRPGEERVGGGGVWKWQNEGNEFLDDQEEDGTIERAESGKGTRNRYFSKCGSFRRKDSSIGDGDTNWDDFNVTSDLKEILLLWNYWDAHLLSSTGP